LNGLTHQELSSRQTHVEHLADAERHRGLLIASVLLIGGAVVVAGGYGIGIGSLALKALIVAYSKYFQVSEGYNAVVTRFGDPIRSIRAAGLYWK